MQLAYFIHLVSEGSTPFAETTTFTWVKSGKDYAFPGSHFHWIKEDYVFAFAPSQAKFEGWNLGYFQSNNLRYNVQDFTVPESKYKFQGL